jgi:hypothetical protein
LEEAIAARAKENQSGGQGGVLLKQKSAEASTHIETREEIAKLAGVSPATVKRGAKWANLKRGEAGRGGLDRTMVQSNNEPVITLKRAAELSGANPAARPQLREDRLCCVGV